MKRREFIKGGVLTLACALVPVNLTASQNKIYNSEDVNNVYFEIDCFDIKDKETIESALLRMINRLIRQGIEINNNSIVVYEGAVDSFEIKCRCVWPEEAIDPRWLKGMKYFKLKGKVA